MVLPSLCSHMADLKSFNQKMITTMADLIWFLPSTCSHMTDMIKLYKEKSATVTVEDVAAFAERAYQPGREKKEMTTQVEQREEVLNYFKRKVKVLGIDVVI